MFLLNHLRMVTKTSEFRFRNGMKIKLDRVYDDGWSPTILMDIFVKEEYGKIENDSIIVDIGANIGAFSLYCAFFNGCTVYSFEPDKRNFELMLENIRINGLEERIYPFDKAVSDISGIKKLYKSISMSHSLNVVSDTYVDVESITLRDILITNDIKKVDYLKLDCEGGEYDILYNTDSETFAKVKNILLEYHNQINKPGDTGNAIKSHLIESGYMITEHKIISDELGILRASRK